MPRTRLIFSSPVRGWVLLFVAANLFLPQDGGGNPRARFATLAAMAEDGSFRIDDLVDRRWSWDWSSGAGGHLYANKAPGPMLLGYPFYRALDVFVTRGLTGRDARMNARREHEALYGTVLSLLLQVLPFAAVVAAAAAWLRSRGASPEAVHFAVVAALFGNTASIFMNTYFGHGMSATFLLAAVLCLVEDRYLLVGLFTGAALLSEYAAVFALLPVLAAVLLRAGVRRAAWVRLGAGALAPAALWSWYHTVCFGSPFRSALQSLNPMFVTDPTLFGVPVSAGENLRIVYELLLGPSRGLLFTQPWVLVLLGVLAVLAWRDRRSARGDAFSIAVVAAATFAGLLFMCSRHPSGWHSGWSSGPRYLCVVFPVFALLGGVLLDRLPRWTAAALFTTLVPSVALQVLALSTTILSPTFKPLWPELTSLLRDKEADLPRARFGLVSLLLLLLTWRARKPDASQDAAA